VERVIRHTARILHLVQPGEISTVQMHEGMHSSSPIVRNECLVVMKTYDNGPEDSQLGV
jgi:hypothetical protein